MFIYTNHSFTTISKLQLHPHIWKKLHY